jgi:hypothetical protein
MSHSTSSTEDGLKNSFSSLDLSNKEPQVAVEKAELPPLTGEALHENAADNKATTPADEYASEVEASLSAAVAEAEAEAEVADVKIVSEAEQSKPGPRRWHEGDDPLEAWCVTDEKQLESIPLPNPNRVPCEATSIAIRAFIKRGLRVTKLALAWWLAWNVDEIQHVTDLITLEDALDTGIKARVPTIFMILAEYLPREKVQPHRTAVLAWYREATCPDSPIALRRTAPMLGAILVEMGWIDVDDIKAVTIPRSVPESK